MAADKRLASGVRSIKIRAWQKVGSRIRVAAMMLLGAGVAVSIAAAGSWGYGLLAGWDSAAALFIAWVWLTIARMSAATTQVHATREDPGRAASDVIVILSAVASLASIGYVLIQASSSKGSTQDALVGLSVGSVALSWFTVHTLFALKYARLYYLGAGGVNFNQELPPRYVDFAYLAFTIGMTFQVSDTDLESPTIRATALRHALLSFLFGAVILASTINLVAGLTTSSSGGAG